MTSITTCPQGVTYEMAPYRLKCRDESKRDGDSQLMSKLGRSTRMNAKCDEDMSQFTKLICDNQIEVGSPKFGCMADVMSNQMYGCILNAKKNSTTSTNRDGLPIYDETKFVGGRNTCSQQFVNDWNSNCLNLSKTVPTRGVIRKASMSSSTPSDTDFTPFPTSSSTTSPSSPSTTPTSIVATSASSSSSNSNYYFIGGAVVVVVILIGVGIWYFKFRQNQGVDKPRLELGTFGS